MPTSVPALLVYAGLVAALFLLAASQTRALALVAVIASAFEVLRVLGIVHLEVKHVPLGLVLGALLAIPSLIAWFRATTKAAITAAAVAALVGTVQVVGLLLSH